MILGQYYGALRAAAAYGPPGTRVKVFLMPLGGGVFNVRSETIAGAISAAVELVAQDLGPAILQDRLDVRVLAWSGQKGAAEEMAKLLDSLEKLRDV